MIFPFSLDTNQREVRRRRRWGLQEEGYLLSPHGDPISRPLPPSPWIQSTPAAIPHPPTTTSNRFHSYRTHFPTNFIFLPEVSFLSFRFTFLSLNFKFMARIYSCMCVYNLVSLTWFCHFPCYYCLHFFLIDMSLHMLSLGFVKI